MVTQEAMDAIGDINQMISEDYKLIIDEMHKYEAEAEAAQEAIRRNELVEMNQSVLHQVTQNLAGKKALLQYIPHFKKSIDEMSEYINSKNLEGKSLQSYLAYVMSRLVKHMNKHSDDLKQRDIFFNARELTAFRRFSVMVQDAMIDEGYDAMEPAVPSRLSTPGGNKRTPTVNVVDLPASYSDIGDENKLPEDEKTRK